MTDNDKKTNVAVFAMEGGLLFATVVDETEANYEYLWKAVREADSFWEGAWVTSTPRDSNLAHVLRSHSHIIEQSLSPAHVMGISIRRELAW